MAETHMFSASKSKPVVGLDVEAGSVAAAEVHSNGSAEVSKTGIVPLPPGVFREGEVTDPEALGDAIRALFAEHKLGKSVRLGVANQRVAVRMLRLPPIEDPNELEAAVRFQAQDHIPMPLEHAVLDYHVVDRVTIEEGDRRLDVIAVAARRDMLERLLQALQRAGVRPVGIDLAAFGMIRALAREGHGASPYEERVAQYATGPEAAAGESVPEGAGIEPARLYCNLGDVTNLAVARGSTCLFTRISPFGVEGVAQRLAERRGLTLENARKWLVHVGLERPSDEIEGDRETIDAAREVLAEGAAKLAHELRLSLEFYSTQEGAPAIEGAVACGPGSAVPGLLDRVGRELGQQFAVGVPRALSHLGDVAAARLTVSYGLALEE